MSDEFVLMRHPDVDADPKKVTRTAFEKAWSKRGWTEVQTGEGKVEAKGRKNPVADDEIRKET